jgi:hypothetical protein
VIWAHVELGPAENRSAYASRRAKQRDYSTPAFVNSIIQLHGIDDFLLIINIVEIECEGAKGAHLRLEIGDKDGVHGVDHLEMDG